MDTVKGVMLRLTGGAMIVLMGAIFGNMVLTAEPVEARWCSFQICYHYPGPPYDPYAVCEPTMVEWSCALGPTGEFCYTGDCDSAPNPCAPLVCME